MPRLRRFLLGCLVLLPVLPVLPIGAGVGLAAAEPPPAAAPETPAPPPAKGGGAFDYFFKKKQPQPAPSPPAASEAAAPAAPVPAPPVAAAPPASEPKPGEGDHVEMTTYYLVLLRRGPTWTAEETPAVVKLQEAHMANIRRLAQAGTLVLAGPFLEQAGPGSLSGLFLFRAGSRQEVETLTATDPMVQAGRLVPEIFPWLGPKTLHF
ncbi:MAG TPA: YciI family protein [Thermoanaerobaculia bacterium]|nr:YciI family protein [Thermoanaerobaculia bacterium]